ncbi:MAG: FixH family protein [Bacteroidetes bacterium]|nr:FixH family protein [Bacteroidota bacterium]MBP7398102.1 FixH family protein [Chitinophagales bacterium]MBK7110310.1 FixH family protein [Bacteroidota bacterium]MBK8488404.1 FixH family protein [Bacteroidota bacterium]MBK8681832.1 FixH family protein [Bacteroidota bacterium]
MNWGKSIVLAFVIFIGFIMYIVIRSAQESVDLVSEDYYNEELKYQDVIDAEINTLPFKDSIRIEQIAQTIEMEFPDEIIVDAEGEIYFFRPNDIKLDKKILLQTDVNGLQIIGADQFIPGMYVVKVNWNKNGKTYFYQQNIFL